MNVIRAKKKMLHLIRKKLWSYVTVKLCNSWTHRSRTGHSFTQQRYSSAGWPSELQEDTCSFRTSKTAYKGKALGWGKNCSNQHLVLFFYWKQLTSIKSQPPYLRMGLQRDLHCRADLILLVSGFFPAIKHLSNNCKKREIIIESMCLLYFS